MMTKPANIHGTSGGTVTDVLPVLKSIRSAKRWAREVRKEWLWILAHQIENGVPTPFIARQLDVMSKPILRCD